MNIFCIALLAFAAFIAAAKEKDIANRTWDKLSYDGKQHNAGDLARALTADEKNALAGKQRALCMIGDSVTWAEDGDYFRIKDITLSYNVPSKWLSRAGIGSLKVYGSALNLFTFHDVNFWDPERGVDGMGYGVYPQTKTFVIGLDLSF